ncbi:MAG: helix-turn-helix domain-containing protein, partial [Thermomicrobiales bacterium]
MADSDFPSLGSQLRRLRLAAALSQEDLAGRSGVSVRTISDLERGIRSTARLETLRLLAEGLGLSSFDRASLIAAATTDVAPGTPLHGDECVTTYLPSPRNQLIGRSWLVDEIVAVFERDGIRLLTLTGPGGVGKTRLALEAASRVVDNTQQPAIFVPLAPVTDSALVPVEIAQALGIAIGAESPADHVVNFLSPRRLLLVLDNFEHLLSVAPFIARVIEAAPGVSLLVTSRARLRISSEREIHVPPLELPDARADDAEIQSAGAVRLFTERAVAATGQSDPLRAHWDLVAAICRRLDGLPLALELAASRLRVMSPERLLEMLEHRLPVLTGGNRDQPTRQQSMRETIDWSYRLLEPHAQVLFRWLAVFVGGVSQDAVASMGDAAGLDTADAFHSLEELVDSGLLEREPEADRGPRFRMLETIREYGIDQLIEHSELEDAHSAFAEYIYEFVARGAPVPNGAFDPAWQTRIEAEDANVDAAFEWLCHPEHAAKAIEFCAEIGMYWEYRGPWGVAAGRMQKAINLASLEPSLATTKALYWTAGLAMCTGDLARAKETGDIALRMARALGDPRAVAYSLATLAWNAELAEE